jgi:hypothetical protein
MVATPASQRLHFTGLEDRYLLSDMGQFDNVSCQFVGRQGRIFDSGHLLECGTDPTHLSPLMPPTYPTPVTDLPLLNPASATTYKPGGTRIPGADQQLTKGFHQSLRRIPSQIIQAPGLNRLKREVSVSLGR